MDKNSRRTLGDRKALGDHDKALRKDRTSVNQVKAKNEEGWCKHYARGEAQKGESSPLCRKKIMGGLTPKELPAEKLFEEGKTHNQT